MERKYFYIEQGEFIICGKEALGVGERIIELDFFQLANDSDLLSLLHLFYIYNAYGKVWTYESRGEWFAGYITSFNTKEIEDTFGFLRTNPRIKILFENENILTEYKERTKKDLRDSL